MKREEAIKRSSDVSMTKEEAIQQLSFWKELWESKKAECDKYENREYAWEKKYMLNCNIEVCKIAIEALNVQMMAIETLKQLEQKKGRWMMNSGMGTICSNCYYKLETTGLLSTCPNCGAKMEGKE